MNYSKFSSREVAKRAKRKAVKTQEEYDFFYETRTNAASHFCRRLCVKFYPSKHSQLDVASEQSPFICEGCRFAKNEHIQINDKLDRWVEETVTWRADFHLMNRTYPNKTLKMRLVDEPAGIDKQADVAILASDLHPSLALSILLKRWKIPLPDFIISVVGTQHANPIGTKQVNTFRQGFLDAVSCSNTWTIGGGSLHGVDKLISDSVKKVQIEGWMGTREKQFNLIGVVNWDCFEARSVAEQFYFGDLNQQKDPQLDKPFQYFVKKRHADFNFSTQQLSFSLNPFFNNMLAIQGGIKGLLHQEFPMRSAMENLLSNPTLDSDLTGGPLGIPLTLLVLGGDCGTLEHMAQSLENGIPVVVCQGSGGIADIVITALRMAGIAQELLSYQKAVIIKEIKGLINQPKLEQQLFSADYMDASTQLRHISICLRHRILITVYRLDKPQIGSQLDQCILKAILSGKAAAQHDPVALGLKWGKCDDLFRHILVSEGDINTRSNMRQLCRAAFVEDKTEFVSLFLGLDLDLSHYVTRHELRLLYLHSIREMSYLRKVFSLNRPAARQQKQQQQKQKQILQQEQQRSRNGFLNDQWDFSFHNVYKVIYCCSSTCEDSLNKNFYPGTSNHDDSSEQTFNSEVEAAQELFWWSIFSKRLEMSTFLWRRTQNRIATALIAASLCRTCEKHIDLNETFHLSQFQQMRGIYDAYAIDLLSQVWAFNECLARNLLTRQLEKPLGSSVFEIAHFAQNKDFICHVAFQAAMDEFWKSSLKLSYPQLLLSIFYPLKAARKIMRVESEKRGRWQQVKTFPLQKELSKSDISENSSDVMNEQQPIRESNSGSCSDDAINGKNHEMNTSEISSVALMRTTCCDSSSANNSNNHFKVTGAIPDMAEQSPSTFVSLYDATLMFYKSPAVKFLLHFVTFVFFLSFYSCFVIYYMKSCPLDPVEGIVTLFNVSYLLESLTMLFSYKGPLSLKMRFWFRCEWISIQALAALFGLGAFVCKLFCTHMHDVLVDNASTLYGASVLLTWIRLLSFYRCSRRLGPLWVLIRRMMHESVGFMLIFFVISLSAGMFIQVLMDIYQYSDPYAGSMQWLLLRPFFMFTGENFLKVVTTNVEQSHGQMQAIEGGKTSTGMTSSEAEAEGDRFVTIYTITSIVYFLLGNALMLNLLVAIFSEIFNKVFVRSDAEFKNEFLILTKEFELITVMPAPFSLLEITYQISKQLLLVITNLVRGFINGQLAYEDRLYCRGVPQSSVNEKNVINYFEEECLHEMLAEQEQVNSNELIVRDAIRRVDEQQGRLADMNIILCEVNRLISEKFARQRRRNMQMSNIQMSPEKSNCG